MSIGNTIRGWLRDVFVSLLIRKYNDKPLQIRAFKGPVRTIEKRPGVYEAVRNVGVRETRTISGVTYTRAGNRYDFFVNATSPEPAEDPAQRTLNLGPMSQNIQRAVVSVKRFHVREIFEDENGFYVIEEPQ